MKLGRIFYRGRLWAAVGAFAGAGLAASVVLVASNPTPADALPSACSGPTVVGSTATVTCSFLAPDGGAQTWTVPTGVTRATFTVNGAQGGDGFFFEVGTTGSGGLGGRTVATLPVTPADTITVMVGGHGGETAGGFNGGGNGGALCEFIFCISGGGGGGASDVRIGGTDLAHRLLVAGGGGGGGGNDGGGGGGLTGGTGQGTGGGSGGNQSGTSGSGQAGAGGDSLGASGGGGGGLWGGAAGTSFGSGGGGSGFAWPGATNVTLGSAAQSGDGQVVITYTVPTVITGSHPGALIVQSGSALLLDHATVGAVIVQAGGDVDAESSTIASLSASGASSLRVCASTMTGSVTVGGSTGFVLIGDTGDDACAVNHVGGSLTLQHNAHGLEAIGNHVAGGVTATGNSGAGPYLEDTAPDISGNGP